MTFLSITFVVLSITSFCVAVVVVVIALVCIIITGVLYRSPDLRDRCVTRHCTRSHSLPVNRACARACVFFSLCCFAFLSFPCWCSMLAAFSFSGLGLCCAAGVPKHPHQGLCLRASLCIQKALVCSTTPQPLTHSLNHSLTPFSHAHTATASACCTTSFEMGSTLVKATMKC